ncbi:hypothetical protein KSP40_PGU011656 [Platanthera guangdongensis]|uniref:Uncharacterized protein n=1 Tax=Platanthera guangdongensis TaxID=2320717 RepID=A0ABR2LCY7_9ASPA
MLLRSFWILIKPPPSSSVKASPPAKFRLPALRFYSRSAEEKMAEKAGQEKQKPPPTASWDAMSDSFGHGYSTRSDDEGFGGICAGNQFLRDGGEEPVAAEQGSEVKQKERARHQEDAAEN